MLRGFYLGFLITLLTLFGCQTEGEKVTPPPAQALRVGVWVGGFYIGEWDASYVSPNGDGGENVTIQRKDNGKMVRVYGSDPKVVVVEEK